MKEDDLNAILLVAALGGIAYLLISKAAKAATPPAVSPVVPPMDYGISQDDWG